jgi:glycolate oxidase FAD binding subunit
MSAVLDLDAASAAIGSACGHVSPAGPLDAVDGTPAQLVARPGTTAEVGEVLRAAAAHGLTVVPRGRGTTLSWGRAPERADLVVDLSRMDAVLDHAAGDLIVDVQAGARLADVQRAVAGAGQRLALDETVPGASIGGTLATGSSGPRRLTAGTARDLLIGVTVVRADGVIAKSGGRVVKNVAGYDLGKLLIGSFGTLAVITEAVFRLHPRASARRVVTVPVGEPAEAGRLVQLVLHAQVVPTAVELDRAPVGPATLSVLVEGSATGVVARAEATRRLLGDAAVEAEELPPGWGRYPWATGGTALKATFAVSALPRVLAAAADAGTALHLRGSAGAGVLYGGLPADADVPAVVEVVDRVRVACTAAGGALVVLDGPPAVKAAVDSWGAVPAIDLMRRVKERFDPERRLSPGRFVGGI